MTSEGLGEMFEGDFADTCGGKFPLMYMGGQAEGLACADPGVRTPIGASGNYLLYLTFELHCILTADIHGLICKTNAITLQPVSRRFCQLGHITFLAEALAAIITLTSLNISPKQP